MMLVGILLPPSYLHDFSQTVGLRKRVEQSIHGGEATSKIKVDVR